MSKHIVARCLVSLLLLLSRPVAAVDGNVADFDLIRDYLAGRDVSPHSPEQIEARCSVAGTTECNIRDLLFLKMELDLGAGVGSPEVRCDAALSPAAGP